MSTTATASAPASAVEEAREALDRHVREMIAWHFSPETGCPYWLERAAELGWEPREEVTDFAGLQKFDNFDDEVLRKEDPARFIPKAFAGKPYNVFETGGTTGMPKQRIGWEDYKVDYEEFGDHYGPDFFPQGGNWLMVGPTGPRRLRLSIEHLANYRGGACYFIDLDPRWVKRLISRGEIAMARQYQEHVIDQAVTIIRHRDIKSIFTTPKLLESLAERISLVDAGIKGVFAGGTTMTPQYVRFIEEEVLEGKINYAPTYGNTLMGLAISRKRQPGEYSLTYHALERDEAIRREPCGEFAWDGVGDVRPFQSGSKKVIEGVY